MTHEFSGAADAAEEWMRSWSASVSERAAQAQAMSQRVADLSVSATNGDGAVEVTVAASGVVTDLRLGARVRTWPSDEIAAEILTTMRRAQARLGAAVAEIAAQTVGANSESARAVVASYANRFPDPPDDRDDHGQASRGRGGW
ncbi:YbaB/EbfC family DNA-binding protein [Micromonospora sp. WMMC415]|uniref:YbaB/EbfC family nucleoid-associated protein n=1 Tax=Micromonospora sp. WMMC415 TaxID=2675222 RepID=UPI0012B4D73C|nr:YbaB/EbfC family nucleoid-associated protein [Micromonospora sp. WMMC415]QGN48441.1 YbaB/EbfC family DNA-binding protein [Micromonospora sp. WMMC415]